MNKKYDWDKIEQAFMNAGHRSKVSLKTISEKYQIPYQTVRRYAAKQKWQKRRCSGTAS